MLNRRFFIAHSQPAIMDPAGVATAKRVAQPGNHRTVQQPVNKCKPVTRAKRNPKAKSFNSPYMKMTPVLSKDDDDVIMIEDDDEFREQDYDSVVKDPIIVCIAHI